MYGFLYANDNLYYTESAFFDNIESGRPAGSLGSVLVRSPGSPSSLSSSSPTPQFTTLNRLSPPSYLL